MPAEQVFRKHCGKRRNCSLRAISPFPTVFSTPFLELSAIFIKLKIVVYKLFQFGGVLLCRLGQSYTGGKSWFIIPSRWTKTKAFAKSIDQNRLSLLEPWYVKKQGLVRLQKVMTDIGLGRPTPRRLTWTEAVCCL